MIHRIYNKNNYWCSNATATDGASDDDYDLSTSGGTAISAGSSQVLTFGPG